MKTLAAVLVEPGKPLELWELEIPTLKPGQVLVEIEYSGVCRTQVLEARGDKGADPYCPHCIGHEGVGSVVSVGEGVSRVTPGQKVIISWMKGEGGDVPGTQYRSSHGATVNAGGVTTFARHSVISENRLTVMPESLAPLDAAVLGCAVATGMGAVFNTGQCSPGQRVVVFGVGGIGLSAVAAARIAGASAIVAVDIDQKKLVAAQAMGATVTVNADKEEPFAILKKHFPAGADLVVEATGRTAVMNRVLEAVRNQGGIAVVLGNARFDERVMFDPKQLNMGKQLRGSWGGDNVPQRDFPKYCQMLQDGSLSLAPIQLTTYPLSEVNRALNDLAEGRVIRPVIDTRA
jgi:S-(hydroxymethyl)glutathione dehydrogenase/alcohol dehydrogenase